MRTILVTGAAGFIGSNLVNKLLLCDDFVIGLDNFDPYYDPVIKRKNLEKAYKNNRFVMVEGNILDKDLLNNILHKYSPTHFVHLAAEVGVRNSFIVPKKYFDVNIVGTLTILEAIKDKKIKNLIYASSSSVYGNNKKLPFLENDNTENQISPYAVSKKSSELLLKQYASIFKIPVTIFRFFTVYGPGQRPDMAIGKFINNIKDIKSIDIYGDGTISRDYTFIDDAVEAICLSVNKPYLFEIINIGSSNPISLKTLISLIEKKLDKKSKINYRPFQRGDVKKTWANIAKAKKLLGWYPKVNIDSGLTETIDLLNITT